MERRFFTMELRAVEEGGRTVAGYAAVFGRSSLLLYNSFKEQIDRGAFAGSIGGDVRALWNHNDDIVLGRTKAGTLRLREDAHGLGVEIDMPQARPELLESIQRGDVDQMSFAFEVEDEEWGKDADGVPLRTLRKVRLFEVSPVAFPAYPDTTIAAMRGNALGDMPQIPAHLRRDGQGDDAKLAQGRTAVRRRRLALMDIAE